MTLKKTIIEEIGKIKKNLCPPLAIQIPEGLKQFSLMILEELKEFQPVLFTDPCFGACDIKDKEAKELGCKLLLHFGHKRLPLAKNSKIRIIYVPLDYKLDDKNIEDIVHKIKELKFKKINLVTTAQYLASIPKIEKALKENNIETIKAKETKRLQEHQVLGCDCSTISDYLEPIIFIGDGYFHVNNISFIHNKQKIYAINPLTKTQEEIKINETFLRQRYAAIARARKCESFGILVSSKYAQNRIKVAKKIQKKLEAIGKKAYIFVSDFINEEYLLGINVECYVNTACPRITYDDFKNFKKPIISVTEIEQILDIKKKIKIDQIN